MNHNIKVSFKHTDIQFDIVFHFLKTSYWGQSYEYHDYKKALSKSLVCSLFFEDRQIGFARIVGDCFYVGYLADVFIIEEFRGKGFGKLMLEKFLASPDVTNIQRITLSTNDAHSLYKKLGFQEFRRPQNQMEIIRSKN